MRNFLYIVEHTRFTKLMYTVLGEMNWKGQNPFAPPNFRNDHPTYICQTWVNGKPKNAMIQLGPKHTTYGPDQYNELRALGFLR